MKTVILFFTALVSLAVSSYAMDSNKDSGSSKSGSIKLESTDKKYSDLELIQMGKKGVYLPCEKYHFSICPEHCVKECISSSPSGVTADCDGPGSCKTKTNK